MILQDMTNEQLSDLRSMIDVELEKRNEDKPVIFELYGKALKPASYKQIQLFEKLGGKIETTNSQVIKRMESFAMSEAIDLVKSGKRVIIR